MSYPYQQGGGGGPPNQQQPNYNNQQQWPDPNQTQVPGGAPPAYMQQGGQPMPQQGYGGPPGGYPPQQQGGYPPNQNYGAPNQGYPGQPGFGQQAGQYPPQGQPMAQPQYGGGAPSYMQQGGGAPPQGAQFYGAPPAGAQMQRHGFAGGPQQGFTPAPGGGGANALAADTKTPPAAPIVTVDGGAICQLVKADWSVEVHISTAFVTLNAQFQAPAHGGPVGGVYRVPMNSSGTVTSNVVYIGERKFETTVISADDAKELQDKKSKDDPMKKAYEGFDPNQFRLPLPPGSIAPGALIRVTTTYFEPLPFLRGEYKLTLKNLWPQNQVAIDPATGAPRSRSACQSIFLAINAGTPYCRWGTSSHPLTLVQEGPGFVQLAADRNQPWPETESFDITYSVLANDILSTMVVERALPGAVDSRDTFALFVTPPSGGVAGIPGGAAFPKSIVFVLDRSGSMSGEPMRNAIQALSHAMQELKTGLDMFNIVAYDDLQEWFQEGGLVPANPETIQRALAWASAIEGRGLTDIMTPLTQTYALLEAQAPPNHLPSILLITDGAVEDEREICKVAKEKGEALAKAGKRSPRVHTLGIGTHCNGFFLKQLSQVGRGVNDLAYDAGSIAPKIEYLFGSISEPALTDIEVGLSGVSNVEIQPFPIPDLFVGAPVTIVGKFSGQLPGSLHMRGQMPNGQTREMQVMQTGTAIPVNKIFTKMRLDLLTAQAWLEESEELRKKVIELSVEEQMPCAHTQTVAYEVPAGKGGEEDKKKDDPKDKPKKKGRSAGKIAALAVGGAAGIVVVGAAAMHFGNLGGTMSNMPGLGSFDGISEGLAGAGGAIIEGLSGAVGAVGDGIQNLLGGECCCPCLEPLCGPWITNCECCAPVCAQGNACLGNVCGGCAEPCGSIFGGCIGSCQGLCDGAAGCIGGVFGDCGGMCDGLCAAVGGGLEGLCGLCGDCSCLSGISELLGGCMSGIGSLFGAVFSGEACSMCTSCDCGAVTECCSGCGAAVGNCPCGEIGEICGSLCNN